MSIAHCKNLEQICPRERGEGSIHRTHRGCNAQLCTGTAPRHVAPLQPLDVMRKPAWIQMGWDPNGSSQCHAHPCAGRDVQQGGLGCSSTFSATPWYKSQKVLFDDFCHLQRDPNMLPGHAVNVLHVVKSNDTFSGDQRGY